MGKQPQRCSVERRDGKATQAETEVLQEGTVVPAPPRESCRVALGPSTDGQVKPGCREPSPGKVRAAEPPVWAELAGHFHKDPSGMGGTQPALSASLLFLHLSSPAWVSDLHPGNSSSQSQSGEGAEGWFPAQHNSDICKFLDQARCRRKHLNVDESSTAQNLLPFSPDLPTLPAPGQPQGSCSLAGGCWLQARCQQHQK